MNRIERMVAEMCPDGVEFIALSEAVQYSTARVSANRLDGTTFVGVDNLVANCGGRVDADYSPNTDYVAAFKAGDVLIGNIRPYLKKIWLADRSGGASGDVLVLSIVSECESKLDSEFLFILLSSEDFFVFNQRHARGGKMPRGDKSAILRYRIPVPPIEIQREIVDILDSFTKLEAELEAELEARRAQYAFYRDQLLSFEPARMGGRTSVLGLSPFKVEWKPMGEVGSLRRGRRFTLADIVEDGIPAIHYGEIYTSYGAVAYKSQVSVSPVLGGSLRYANSGDVIMACVGESVEDLGQGVAWLGDSPIAYHDDSVAWSTREDSRFLSYFLRSRVFDRQKRSKISKGKVKRITPADLRKIQVPIPPLEVQKKIADVLDSFDALVNDLSSGLPAEIAARRQQYEYYRDRLLTFPEKK